MFLTCEKRIWSCPFQRKYGKELQYQHVGSRHHSPYISYGTSWEKLLKHQDILSFRFIPVILMTYMFDQDVILQGEVRRLSLFRPKSDNGRESRYDSVVA